MCISLLPLVAYLGGETLVLCPLDRLVWVEGARDQGGRLGANSSLERCA